MRAYCEHDEYACSTCAFVAEEQIEQDAALLGKCREVLKDLGYKDDNFPFSHGGEGIMGGSERKQFDKLLDQLDERLEVK